MLLDSRKTNILLWVVGICFSLVSLVKFYESLSPEFSYKKDLYQDFLMGRAVNAKLEPYLPVNELCERLKYENCNQIFHHASPHPPANLLWFPSLAKLGYQNLILVWGLASIGSLFISAVFIKKAIPNLPFRTSLIFLLLLGSDPARKDLILGQLGTMNLMAWSIFLALLHSKRERIRDIVLGLVCSLKLSALGLVAYLALSRNYKSLIFTLLSVAVFSVLPGLFNGDMHLLDFVQAGREVSALYQGSVDNFSISTFPQRACHGTNEIALRGPIVSPLLDCEPGELGRYLGLSIMALAAIAVRKEPFNVLTVSGLLAVSLVSLPVTWTHSTLLFVIAILSLSAAKLPSFEKITLTVVSLIWFYGEYFYLLGLSSEKSNSFIQSLPNFLPSIMGLSLFTLCLRTNRAQR